MDGIVLTTVSVIYSYFYLSYIRPQLLAGQKCCSKKLLIHNCSMLNAIQQSFLLKQSAKTEINGVEQLS